MSMLGWKGGEESQITQDAPLECSTYPSPPTLPPLPPRGFFTRPMLVIIISLGFL